jgi:hypothetical protein
MKKILGLVLMIIVCWSCNPNGFCQEQTGDPIKFITQTNGQTDTFSTIDFKSYNYNWNHSNDRGYYDARQDLYTYPTDLYSYRTMDMTYNKPLADVFASPWYLDSFQQPTNALQKRTQEFYYFTGLKQTNPADYIVAPTYPKRYPDPVQNIYPNPVP